MTFVYLSSVCIKGKLITSRMVRRNSMRNASVVGKQWMRLAKNRAQALYPVVGRFFEDDDDMEDAGILALDADWAAFLLLFKP